MTDFKAFWFHEQMPQGYHKLVNKNAPGVVDESIIANFIEKYKPHQEKIIVDLGIGTGRELVWLDNLRNIRKIVGIDYSPAMIAFCKKIAKSCSHKVDLFIEDLFYPQYLKAFASENTTNPLIYLSLLNSFGNFTKEERPKILKKLKRLMKNTDRIIFAIYKTTQHVKQKYNLKNNLSLNPTDPRDEKYLSEIIEYGSYGFLWNPVIDKYHTLPRFWYNKKANDIVIHINGKRLYISHRFTKDEIQDEFKKSGLKIDKIIEGKAMWIAVGKI